MNNYAIEKIRQLKGAPLSVYLVLCAVGQRVSQEFVQRHTGYTDKPVSQALAYLADLGHVDHNQVGWGLAGEKLVLGAGDALVSGSPSPESTAPASEPVEDPEPVEENNSDTISGSRNNSDLFKLSKLSINTLIKDDTYLLNLSGQGRNNSDSTAAVMVKAGILPKIAAQIAPTIQVSAGQLKAIIWEMSQEKRYTPGLLVHRLRKDPALCQRQLTWSTKRWSEWLIDQRISADFDLVQDLARDYPDPGEALDKLPLVGLTRQVIEECLWEVVA